MSPINETYWKFIVSFCKFLPPVSPIEVHNNLIYFSQNIFIECFCTISNMAYIMSSNFCVQTRGGGGSIFISVYQILDLLKYPLPYDYMKLVGRPLWIGFFDKKWSLTKYSVGWLILQNKKVWTFQVCGCVYKSDINKQFLVWSWITVSNFQLKFGGFEAKKGKIVKIWNKSCSR